MSILRKTLEAQDKKSLPKGKILLNPVIHRNLVFRAINSVFAEETEQRIAHYISRSKSTKCRLDVTRQFEEETVLHKTRFSVSKYGRMYLVEGKFYRKDSGEGDNIQAWVKTIPKKGTKANTSIKEDFGTLGSLAFITGRIARLEEEVRYLKENGYQCSPKEIYFGGNERFHNFGFSSSDEPNSTQNFES